MSWTDCLLGKSCLRLGGEEMRRLYHLLVELDFARFDLPYEAAAGIAGTGLPLERFRVECDDVEKLATLVEQGFRQLRLTSGCFNTAEKASGGRSLTLSLVIETAAELQDFAAARPEAAGIDPVSVVLWDRKAGLDAWSAREEVGDCRRILPGVPVEFQGSSLYHMGTAAALGAMQAGAEGLVCSVGGVGESVAWEEALLAGIEWGGQQIVIPLELTEKCREILELARETLPLHKAVIGENVFAHESGIHVHGILKQPDLYEPYPPERVGQVRRIVMGGSSGRAALKWSSTALGFACPESGLPPLLEKIKRISRFQGHGLTQDQLMLVLREHCPHDSGRSDKYAGPAGGYYPA